MTSPLCMSKNASATSIAISEPSVKRVMEEDGEIKLRMSFTWMWDVNSEEPALELCAAVLWFLEIICLPWFHVSVGEYCSYVSILSIGSTSVIVFRVSVEIFCTFVRFFVLS